MEGSSLAGLPCAALLDPLVTPALRLLIAVGCTLMFALLLNRLADEHPAVLRKLFQAVFVDEDPSLIAVTADFNDSEVHMALFVFRM